jgi:DNA-binding transcriptional LysR family regulator
MDWDGLQVFLAIARAGRISAAARRLGVRHTTVSRRLAALESALGVPLFYRTKTGYLLTPHGKNILSHADAMERTALAVAARAREGSHALAGCVRIAMPPEFASDWLAPRLGAFRAAHPQIDLQLLVGTNQRDLSRGEADLAIQTTRPRQTGVLAVRIARTSTGLYASKALLGSRRPRVSGADELQDLPLVAYTPPFQLLQEAKWFQPVLASARVVLESNSTHALLAAALAGVGVAVLPRFVARAHADLVAVSDNVAEQDVLLLRHSEFRRDPKVQAAADFLRRLAADLI